MSIDGCLDTTDRMLSWLSLLGNGDVTKTGKPLTQTGRRLPVVVSDSFFRKFTCVEGCFVCCAVLNISLDYIPIEYGRLYSFDARKFEPREIVVNGVPRTIYSTGKPRAKQDRPRESDGSKYCTFLKPVRNGQLGCSLWQTGSPLGCSTAYNMRVTELAGREVRITKQGLARAWRYDPAPECEFEAVPVDKADLETNVGLFRRLMEWAAFFELPEAYERCQAIRSRLEDFIRQGTAERFVIP